YVTTRNKYMRCEKLFYGYHVEFDRFLCIQGTPGDVELRDLAVPLTQRVLRYGRPRHLHALFDAGAGKADADVRALCDLAAAPPEVLATYRQRQHHEQGYRVTVHDEGLNASPHGYDTESPNRRRPRFHRGPLQMIGWLLALVYNAIGDLTRQLPDRFLGAHVD